MKYLKVSARVMSVSKTSSCWLFGASRWCFIHHQHRSHRRFLNDTYLSIRSIAVCSSCFVLDLSGSSTQVVLTLFIREPYDDFYSTWPFSKLLQPLKCRTCHVSRQFPTENMLMTVHESLFLKKYLTNPFRIFLMSIRLHNELQSKYFYVYIFQKYLAW